MKDFVMGSMVHMGMIGDVIETSPHAVRPGHVPVHYEGAAHAVWGQQVPSMPSSGAVRRRGMARRENRLEIMCHLKAQALT